MQSHYGCCGHETYLKFTHYTIKVNIPQDFTFPNTSLSYLWLRDFWQEGSQTITSEKYANCRHKHDPTSCYTHLNVTAKSMWCYVRNSECLTADHASSVYLFQAWKSRIHDNIPRRRIRKAVEVIVRFIRQKERGSKNKEMKRKQGKPYSFWSYLRRKDS